MNSKPYQSHSTFTINGQLRIQLVKLAKKVTKRPVESDLELLQQRREKLQDSIDEFCRLGQVYLPARARTVIPDIYQWEDLVPTQSFDDDESDADEVPATTTRRAIDTIKALPAEEQIIPLPSSFGAEACRTFLKPLAEIELALQKAQANEALHNLRLAIGQKSFLYRHKVRKNATNATHKQRLRSRDDVAAVSSSIDLASKTYMSSRRAMKILGASDELLEKYPILQPKEMLLQMWPLAQSLVHSP